MTPELYKWLKEIFYRDNHSKYRYLFDLWIQNITLDQIPGFEKQMFNIKRNDFYNSL